MTQLTADNHTGQTDSTVVEGDLTSTVMMTMMTNN